MVWLWFVREENAPICDDTPNTQTASFPGAPASFKSQNRLGQAVTQIVQTQAKNYGNLRPAPDNNRRWLPDDLFMAEI